jgi:hypothetical protein
MKLKLILTALNLVGCIARAATGTFILGSAETTDCPSGFTCNNFTLDSHGIIQENHPLPGEIAVMTPSAPARRMVVMFSGSGGSKWWTGSNPLTVMVTDFLKKLSSNGVEVVMVRWGLSGWPTTSPGVQEGFEILASRPAAAIKWIYHELYTPAGITGGFIVTGNSEGSAVCGYVISNYGLSSIITHLIPTSGPPLARIGPGCLEEPGYGYVVPAETSLIDQPWGWSMGQCGPCCRHDNSFIQQWNANSVETGGTDYYYPNTRVTFIEGAKDEPTILNHARAFYNVLAASNQPNLTWKELADMGHVIRRYQSGLDALAAAIRQ